MLRSRVELEDYLNNKRVSLNRRKKAIRELAMKAYERFKIPTGDFMDIISGRIEVSKISDFYLFCVTYMIDLLDETLIHQNYFTEKEISLYLKTQIQDELQNFFPIVFDCTQTTSDQWIGSINASFLMKLRRLQLIRYNPETQRVMNRVVRGDKEIFKIAIDKTTAENIAKSFEDEIYIPDTITLNILPDSEADFFYDAKKKQLVINSIDHFDMTDGFHRYFAMGFVEDKNNGFDYPMELRITNFNVTKAKQFIWQQDQKTKMRRVDSDSMNMNDPSVILLEMLNQEVSSPLKGMMKRNGGQINIGEFAKILDYLYFRDIPKAKHRSQIIVVKKIINNMFNRLFEFDPSYTEKSYSYVELLFLTMSFMRYESLDTERIVTIAVNSMKNMTHALKTKMSNMKLSRTIIGTIEELMEVAYVQRIK